MSEPEYKNLVYEDRIVAFIDILGWRHAVRSAGSDGAQHLGWLVKLLHGLERGAFAQREFFADLSMIPEYGAMHRTEITQFSDCIVISFPAATGYQWILEQTLAQICGTACQSGFLLRGGIVRGLVYHSDRMIYGPALIEAYELEQRARYPRILLDDSVTAIVDGPWRRDWDGHLFFDYLRAFGALPNQYKHLIGKGLLAATDWRVLRKYLWAAKYYDQTLGPDYPGERGVIGVHIGDEIYALERGKWPRPLASRRGSPRPK